MSELPTVDKKERGTEREPGSRDGERTERDTGSVASMVDDLLEDLAGTPIEEATSNGAICRRCDAVGASSDELFIEAGTQVFARGYWEEWRGWQLYGVYHADHAASLRTPSDSPTKPTVTVEARLETADDGEGDTDAYVLADPTLVDLLFPKELSK